MKARRAVLAVLLATMASACSPLRIFNTVMPKDAGATRVAHGMPFGPDKRQTLDVYAPRVHGAGQLAVIVFFYGGSWNSGTKEGYSFLGRALAARGFLVVIPDYRLVPQVRYPAFLQDNAEAVRWIRSHVSEWGGDPDRLILAGHSAGAYNAAMLALDPHWLGQDRRAVKGLIGLAGPYDFLPFKGPVVEKAFAGVADPVATQPVHYAHRGDPPAFLATGDKDTLVLPRNSDALAEGLRSHDVLVERRRYPGVGHVGLITAVAKPLRGHANVLEDMTAFARKVTDGPERM
ncbi:alpha/beta hydrolase [Novosphingobium terrae]|uniref:alpha/beta hydrolase n=1 Tax=Novosphingobium terrae TaxID=2726189 RepID=UPI001980672A|nr:alpha/beta hydrolase [Novosphingobium terrae]